MYLLISDACMTIDLWNQYPNPEGSLIRRLQRAFQKVTSVSPPLFHGRGIMQYSYGIMPHRKALVSVVGAPIDVVKCENPTTAQLIEVQDKYLTALMNLFSDYKGVYGRGDEDVLRFVE